MQFTNKFVAFHSSSSQVTESIYDFAPLVQLTEQNGEEYREEQEHREEHVTEELNGEVGSQEEAVVVDADSSDSAVLVNGNEADEK